MKKVLAGNQKTVVLLLFVFFLIHTVVGNIMSLPLPVPQFLVKQYLLLEKLCFFLLFLLDLHLFSYIYILAIGAWGCLRTGSSIQASIQFSVR